MDKIEVINGGQDFMCIFCGENWNYHMHNGECPRCKAYEAEEEKRWLAQMDLAVSVSSKGPDYLRVYNFYKDNADKYGLWAEVCMNAQLNMDMSCDKFDQELADQSTEWDI